MARHDADDAPDTRRQARVPGPAAKAGQAPDGDRVALADVMADAARLRARIGPAPEGADSAPDVVRAMRDER